MKLLHPLLAAPGRVLAFLAATVALGAVLAALLVRESGLAPGPAAATGLPAGVLLGFGALTSWYAVRTVPRPAREPRRAVILLGSAIGVGTGVWLLLTSLWARLLESLGIAGAAPAALRAAWVPLLVVGLLVYGFAVLLHYLLVALERSQQAERRSLEAATLAREAELAALRAQLAPHFLFNSLNSIASLAGSEPEAARRMCTLLADFFRRSLTAGAARRIAFADELELARTYLAVEQVRFGERLRVAWDVEDGVDAIPVPPLLLQPLVENAVHHGIAHRVDGGIVSIAAAHRSGALRLVIENPVDPDRRPTSGTGTGLENLRRRLRNHAGQQATLTVEEAPERFRVEVALPIDTDRER